MRKNKNDIADIVLHIYVSVFLVAGLLISVYVDSASISIFFDSSRTRTADLFFSVFNLLGEPWLHMLSIFVIGFYNVKKGIIFSCLAGINLIIIVGLKLYFEKPRPLSFFNDSGMLEILNISDHAKILTEDTSFPSYHSAGAFSLCLFLLLHFRNVYFTILLFSAAIMTAIARVYFFHHFFIDTYFGAFIGIILAIFILHIFEKYGKKLDKWNSSFLQLRRIKSDNN